MSKQDLEPFEHLSAFMKLLASPGALLSVIDGRGRPNAMAIGWCTIGVLWSKPICIVYVRPSRHSYTCLEQVRQFAVNAATSDLADAVELCGTKSGRDMDKLQAAGLTTSPGRKIQAPVIDQCILHYECDVVHNNDVLPGNLRYDFVQSCYGQGDFHRLYFGHIVACYGDVDALNRV